MTLPISVKRQLRDFTKLLVALVVSLQFAVLGAQAAYDVENLDRGVVAVSQGNSVFVSWRWLGYEDDSVGFNLYRNGTLVNAAPITDRTNYLDSSGSASSLYAVAAVVNGQEQSASSAVEVWSDIYKRIPLQRPSGGTTPDGVAYTYSPNDASVADLDGDGQYEIVLKWDPSNAKDNAHSGYTGNVFLDAYELDGTHMWRIDLGRNIRAGAHYTQFIVYDLDSDGLAEVACRTSDGSVDGQGSVIGSSSADYRTSAGYILSGPEYLTVFEGSTGRELASTDYVPARGAVSSWGDNYGNRVDRFLAGLAWLDGEKPSLIMSRGYYTRAVVAAWDWRNGQLSSRWVFDSDNGYSAYRGQGAHSLSIADVDSDGRQEVIFGAAAIDDDGSGMYSMGIGHGDALHASDMDPNRPGIEVYMVHETPSSYGDYGSEMHDGATGQVIWGASGEGADVGRGVAMDIDPRYSGYEAWSSRGGLYTAQGAQISSSAPSPKNFAAYWDGDLGREILDNTTVSKWNYSSSSLQTLLSAANYGAASNNGTKATPSLSADILGDWREEILWRDSSNTSLLLFTSTVESSHRIRTLMHDLQYRAAIAWQNAAYNQPPHPSFFLGYDMNMPAMASLNPVGGNAQVPGSAALNTLVVGSSVQLSWSVSNIDDIAVQEVYRDTDADPAGRIRIASLGAYDRSYTDVTAEAGSTYHYWVKITAADSTVYNTSGAEATLPLPGQATLLLQEYDDGYCYVDGAIEADHAGFTGSGYANTTNAVDQTIGYAINIPTAGTYLIRTRFANGSSGERLANLLVNSEIMGSYDMAASGGWTSYVDSPDLSLQLSAGNHLVALRAVSSAGLANIDYLSVSGESPVGGNCDGTVIPVPTAEPTATPTAEPTATPTAEPTATPTAEPTATPTAEPTATPTTEPTPDTGGGAVACIYSVSNNWGSGFTGAITLTNNGSSAINGWQVSWSYSGGASLAGSWNASVSGSNPYTAVDMGWNASIAPGQSVQFGFQGEGGDTSEVPTVSGAVCE